MVLGVCGAGVSDVNKSENNLGYEIDCIIREAKRYYDEILVIDPTLVIHLFDNNAEQPQIIFKTRNIANLTTCVFRGITGVEESISLLARNLHYCGCDILDPPERFSGAPSGKLFDSLKGFNRKILPTTFFAFSANSAVEILDIIKEKNLFPVILKPCRGKRGEHVELAENYYEALNYIKNHFSNNTSNCSLIIQQYIVIEDEFRGIVLGGKCLGLVRKIAAKGKIAHNASQGGTFIVAEDEKTVRFIEENAGKKGLVGVDVALDVNGKMHYIESNRSPQWKSFEAATGVNVAGKLVEYAFQRAKYPSVLF